MNLLINQRSVLGGVLLYAGLIACGCSVRPQEPAITIPLPDVTDAHPKVATALQRLHDALLQDPSSSMRWAELGAVLMAHGWSAEAVLAFENAGERDPDEMRWVYLRAILMEAVDLRQADDLYSQAATLDPSYAPLRYRWAHVLVRLDELSAAEEQLRVASQLAPQSPHPLLALGRAAIDRKDYSVARGHFQKAVAAAPLCREAREQLARANFLLGDHQQAQRDQELASGLPLAYPGLADRILQEVNQQELVARQSAERADQLVASGDASAAVAAFRQLIQDRPDLSRPRLNLAALYAMQGDMRHAAAMYRETIALFPNEALAHQGLAGVLAGTGDIPGAISAYQECVRLKPDYSQAHHAIGQLWEQTGQLEKGIAAYRTAIQADVRFAPAYLALGLALQSKGDHDAAVASIENAVRLAPNDAVPRGYLQRARQMQQQATKRPLDGGQTAQGEDDDDKQEP